MVQLRLELQVQENQERVNDQSTEIHTFHVVNYLAVLFHLLFRAQGSELFHECRFNRGEAAPDVLVLDLSEFKRVYSLEHQV